MSSTALTLAHQVKDRLDQTGLKLVLAESCTCGAIAATLGMVPGISSHLCGSAVTYQNESKQAWLEVPEALLDTVGPVSEKVAVAMAEGVLAKTPHAEIAFSVTGHFGPTDDFNLDGVVYAGFSRWKFDAPTKVVKWNLPHAYDDLPVEGIKADPKLLRLRRREDTVERALQLILTELA